MADRKPGKGLGRKPAHLVAAANYATIDIMWSAIRQLQTFTLEELICFIARQHRINDETAKSYIDRLHRGRFLSARKISQLGCATCYEYTLENDVGVEAPRLNAKGVPTATGKGRENLWRSMRILNRFDYRELAIAASTEDVHITPAAAKDYVQHLDKAGYLQELAPAVRGRYAKPAQYKLMPNGFTGPKPPQIQRLKQVYDPNLNKVMYRDEGGAK